jgi:hypothetical protein
MYMKVAEASPMKPVKAKTFLCAAF